jgi:hypothetical protein
MVSVLVLYVSCLFVWLSVQEYKLVLAVFWGGLPFHQYSGLSSAWHLLLELGGAGQANTGSDNHGNLRAKSMNYDL